MKQSQRSQNANKHFTGEYEFDGTKWAIDSIYAATFEEAEMKLKAVGKGRILGIHAGIVTVDGHCPTCKQPWEGDVP